MQTIGLKVRTFGAVNPKMFEALGAVPVTMIVSEAYEGLKRGTLDAVFIPWTAAYTYKLHEVARYISDVNFGAIVGYMTFINLDLWNSWPQDLKALCNQITQEAEQLSIKIIGEYDRKALKLMVAAGAELVHFQEQEPLKKALPDTITLVQERVAKVGTQYEQPAREYANFLRLELSK
jgi:TRAP-type C4-dicarboxylate transport system substrate-binding protein